MSDKDFGVSITGIPQRMGQLNKKPCYLITLTNANKVASRFIAIDKPDLLTNFIEVKGTYSLLTEEEICDKFAEVISSTPQEEIVHMMFPSHRVSSIRSLVFNAHKLSTLVK